MSNNMKARAWLTNQKVMTSVHSLYFNETNVIALSGKELSFEVEPEVRCFYVENASATIIMLASGLNDKHGTPIYMDSDVVKLTITHEHDVDNQSVDYIGLLTMQDYMLTIDGYGLFNLKDFYIGGYEFEVLGNIYENPELLEEEY